MNYLGLSNGVFVVFPFQSITWRSILVLRISTLLLRFDFSPIFFYQCWYSLKVQPQLERQISQFFCKKVMLYTIFTSVSSWFQPCSFWIDSKAKNWGQPVLEHHRPSPPTCFGSNEGFKSSLVTAETGLAQGALRLTALYFQPFYNFNNHMVEISSKSS